MSSDDTEWEAPPADDEIAWESPQVEHPQPPVLNPVRSISHLIKRVQSKWIIVTLLISLVATSSIAVIEAQQIAVLNSELDVLQSEYDYLLERYNNLFSDHEALKEAYEEPLSNPVTPTYSQLLNWLAQDDTDQCEYVAGVWNCGDFAAMLMTQAKEMNWRTGLLSLVIVFREITTTGQLGPMVLKVVMLSM